MPEIIRIITPRFALQGSTQADFNAALSSATTYYVQPPAPSDAKTVINMTTPELEAIAPQQRVGLMDTINNSEATLAEKVVSIALLNATYVPGWQYTSRLNGATNAFISGMPSKMREWASKFKTGPLSMQTRLNSLSEEAREGLIFSLRDCLADKFGISPPRVVLGTPKNSSEIASYNSANDTMTLYLSNIDTVGKLAGAMLHEGVHDWQNAVGSKISPDEKAALNAARRFYGIGDYGHIFYRANILEDQAFNEMNDFYKAFQLPTA
ncbi:MAG: hypothetical protein V4691_08680 [Pseudomonadota bacterium]